MSERHNRLNGARWQLTRSAVFERDGYRCRECGRAGRLECDHVEPLWKEPTQDPYDPANCQALCRSCHIAKTRKESAERYKLRDRGEESRKWADLVAELSEV